MDFTPHSATAAPPLPSDAFGAPRWLTPLLTAWTRLPALHDLYAAAAPHQGAAFIAALLRELRITVEFDAAELARLPARGAFVAVANHPSGLLDGLVLLHVLLRARPELRVVATEKLAPLAAAAAAADQVVLVNPDPDDPAANTLSVRKLLRYLHDDVPLLLFPAGEVAHRLVPWATPTDPTWHPTAGRLLRAAAVPVVPVWLSGENSAGFSWLGMVHPALRTLRLPAELLNKRGQTIRVRLGAPVTPPALRRLPSADDVLAYLRARVFALGATAGPDAAAATARLPAWPAAEPAPLTAAVPAALLEADLAALRPSRLLVRSRHWEVYVAKANELPNVLPEIGRLRELTFRAEGEGTGEATDLSAFDRHYRHLFLYDREARLLVGAYRLGPGRALLRRFGKRGFYLHTLFRLKDGLRPLLNQAVELGRAFIRPEYQRQALPLALLWKGIAAWLEAHPECRYLIGPVSISNRFSNLSKAVMVDYLTRHCVDPNLARHVRPRKRFRYRPHPLNPFRTDSAPDAAATTATLQASLDSIDALSQLIAGLEPGGAGVPVLLRQYLRQNGRLIGFNLDPAFANALDGFLVLDARHLPDRTHKLLERY